MLYLYRIDFEAALPESVNQYMAAAKAQQNRVAPEVSQEIRAKISLR